MTDDPWSTACPDWEQRLLECRPLVPALPLNRVEAERGLRAFKQLRLPDVAGTPTLGECCDEWFLAIVEVFFGSFDPASGRRMIQEYFELIPKGNSKSSYGGELVLAATIVNRRPRAEFAIVAPTKLIADISFLQAEGTIRLDKTLSDLFHLQRHVRTITNQRSGATLKILAADTDVITGGKQVGTLIDETHELGQKASADKILTEIRGALAKRPDGFLIQCTTQSKVPPAGTFKAELERARAVRDGLLRAPLLPVLYEFPARMQKDGSWKERRFWPCVNPNLNRSVDERFLVTQLESKEREGAGALALFASQHFNVEIGIAQRSDRWAGTDHWKRGANKDVTLDAVLARCDCVVVGIDGGGLDDLFGLTVLGREATETELPVKPAAEAGGQQTLVPRRTTKRWLSWSRAWCSAGVLERRKSIAQTLQDFAADGDLVIVDDDLGDISGIVEIVARIRDAGLLYCVAVDPMAIGELVDALDEIDISQANAEQERDFVVGVQQGIALMAAMKTAERRLANGTLLHADQALMDWAVGNLKIEATATAIRATKQNAGDAKIDPAIALFNAAAILSKNPPSPQSVYESRGIIVLA